MGPIKEISKFRISTCLRESRLSEKDFDELLLEAVDEGLASIGESSKQSIFFYLETVFKIKRHEIPYKIEDFAAAIEKIFGLGAKCLELLMMNHLYEKVKGTVPLHEPKDFTFTAYVAAAKRSFLEKKEAEVLLSSVEGVYAGER
jgi:hypothetical protein